MAGACDRREDRDGADAVRQPRPQAGRGGWHERRQPWPGSGQNARGRPATEGTKLTSMNLAAGRGLAPPSATRAGRLLPVLDRPAGHPAPPEVGPAAHRQQGRRGHQGQHLQRGVHAKFPLLGLKFKNTTGLHLMQGPITVFEDGSYAGDARILDLQPKEERLLSYAIDLGTEVEPVVQIPTDRITNVKRQRGIIHATHQGPRGQDLQHQEPLRARPAGGARASLSAAVHADHAGEVRRASPRRLPLRGQGRGRPDRQAGRGRGARRGADGVDQQHRRQQDPHLHQQRR